MSGDAELWELLKAFLTRHVDYQRRLYGAMEEKVKCESCGSSFDPKESVNCLSCHPDRGCDHAFCSEGCAVAFVDRLERHGYRYEEED
jgi:hypothetical protein